MAYSSNLPLNKLGLAIFLGPKTQKNHFSKEIFRGKKEGNELIEKSTFSLEISVSGVEESRKKHMVCGVLETTSSGFLE